VSSIELDRAKSLLISAKSSYESSKASTALSFQLQEYLKIVAPFDGIVTKRNLSVGALVGYGGDIPLLSMAQTEKLRLTVAIPEKHASSISDELTASFTVSSQPQTEFGAKLSRSSGALNTASRSLQLEFDVENNSTSMEGSMPK